MTVLENMKKQLEGARQNALDLAEFIRDLEASIYVLEQEKEKTKL